MTRSRFSLMSVERITFAHFAGRTPLRRSTFGPVSLVHARELCSDGPRIRRAVSCRKSCPAAGPNRRTVEPMFLDEPWSWHAETHGPRWPSNTQLNSCLSLKSGETMRPHRDFANEARPSAASPAPASLSALRDARASVFFARSRDPLGPPEDSGMSCLGLCEAADQAGRRNRRKLQSSPQVAQKKVSVCAAKVGKH